MHALDNYSSPKQGASRHRASFSSVKLVERKVTIIIVWLFFKLYTLYSFRSRPSSSTLSRVCAFESLPGLKAIMSNVPSKLCACAQVVRRVHARKLGAHETLSFQRSVYTLFHAHLPIYRWFPRKMLHKRNFAHTQMLQN